MQTHSMDVRPVTEHELGQVLNLIDQYDRPKAARPADREQRDILARICSGGGAVFGVFEGHRLIATCTLNICANLSWTGRPFGIIENVIVDATRRGQGIGKRLLSAAVQRAREQHCYKVALMTGSTKPETLGFYASAGFSASKTGFQIRFV